MQQNHNSVEALPLTNPIPADMLDRVLDNAYGGPQQIARQKQITRWALGFVPRPVQLRLI